jgi:hypothetical protein
MGSGAAEQRCPGARAGARLSVQRAGRQTRARGAAEDVVWQTGSDTFAGLDQVEHLLRHAAGVSWHPKLKAAYLGFQRPGGYYCGGITISTQAPLEFWIKLPLPVDELRARGQDVPQLYPELDHRWDGNNEQLTWKIASLDAIPDFRTAVNLTSRYQPPSAPMPKRSSASEPVEGSLARASARNVAQALVRSAAAQPPKHTSRICLVPRFAAHW